MLAEALLRAVFAMMDAGATEKDVRRVLESAFKVRKFAPDLIETLDEAHADVMAERAVWGEDGEVIYLA